MTLSVEKTTALPYRSRGHAPKRSQQLKLSDSPNQRVKTHRYIGLLIDDRVTWRPEVRKVFSQNRSLLEVLRCFRGHSWGTAQRALLKLYHGLFLFRPHYTLSFLTIGRAQQREIETFHRVALRMCLGLPRYTVNVAAPVAAEDWPVVFRGAERANPHLARNRGVSSHCFHTFLTAQTPLCLFGKAI